MTYLVPALSYAPFAIFRPIEPLLLFSSYSLPHFGQKKSATFLLLGKCSILSLPQRGQYILSLIHASVSTRAICDLLLYFAASSLFKCKSISTHSIFCNQSSFMETTRRNNRTNFPLTLFPLNRQALAPRDNTHSQFAFRANNPRISGFPDSLRDFCSQSVATGRIGRFTSWPVAIHILEITFIDII